MDTPNECPECGQQYNTHILICVPCGIDLKTGKPMSTPVQLDPEEEVELTPAQRTGVLFKQLVVAYFPGVFRPGLLILALVVGLIGVAGICFGLVLVLGFGAIFTGAAVASFGALIYAHALSWVFMSEMGLLIDGLVEFDSIHWYLFTGGIAVPFAAFFYLLKAAAELAV